MEHRLSYFDKAFCFYPFRDIDEDSHFYVKGFLKAEIVDEGYFSSIECDVIREILLKDYKQELKNRKSQNSDELTKVMLTTCHPESADFVWIHDKSGFIVPIKYTKIARINPYEYPQAKVDEKRSEVDQEILRQKQFNQAQYQWVSDF